MHFNRFAVLLILRGTVRINLGCDYYAVSANHLLIVLPAQIIRIEELSEGFEAKVLMLDATFLSECNAIKLVRKYTPPVIAYMQLRKDPYTLLTTEEVACMENCFRRLEEKIELRGHVFHQEVIQNSILAFLLELGNILVSKKDLITRPAFSRKEDLMNRFLQLLLQHAATQHRVAFYAGELCITPQYLSMVLTELTGKPANKWIEDTLIQEAKLLLKSSLSSVQQVAEALNFSDQSTFGKFFRKCTGLTPREYRRL
jgi:AraC-like DNA-binding protein